MVDTFLNQVIWSISNTNRNCQFPVSTGDQTLHVELRFLVALELFLNTEFYADHPKFPEVKQKLGFKMDTVYSSALCDMAYDALMTTKSIQTAVQVEAAYTCNLCQFATLLQMSALPSVFKRPIISIYPDANPHIREAFHTMIHPRECKYTKPVCIMWSRDAALDIVNPFSPNHFVLLLKTSNKKLPEKRIRVIKPKQRKPDVVVLDDSADDPQ